MNPFAELCNEEIHIRHQNGSRTGPLKALFEKGKFSVFDGTLDVCEGDGIDRLLPNGKAERYDITEVHFEKQFHDIPGHVDMTVRKQGALVPVGKSHVTNISITNSQGFQVGDHNTQNIVDSLKQVIERIEQSPGTPEEKKEAKSRLSTFLEHPLTSAVLGGAVGKLTELLK